MRKEQIVTVSSHSKLQYYRHNYGQVCMTGLLGGRWHRYQQSQRDSRKRDFVYCALIVLVYVYILFFFYYWLVVENNTYFITMDMFIRVESYFPWYGLALGLCATMVAYFSVILVLFFFHVKYGHQLYVHPAHLLMAAAAFIGCLVVTILLDIYWPDTMPIAFVSLKVFGPFIQIGAVIVMTAVSWVVAREWHRLSSAVFKGVWLSVFIALMLALYLSPMGIKSPMIRSHTPPRPTVVALGGASSHAPENTMFAFEKAVDLGVRNLYTEIQISADGVPFLFSYKSLVATTNVESEFGLNGTSNPTHFNMSTLQSLNAGLWFISEDPWDTVDELTQAEKDEILAQRIPTLFEFLSFVMEREDVNVFLRVFPLPSNHPCDCKAVDVIDQVLQTVPDTNTSRVYMSLAERKGNSTPGLLERDASDKVIKRSGAEAAMLRIDHETIDLTERYNDLGLITIAKDVNSAWMFSLMWCAGVDMVATRYITYIQDWGEPLWKLNKNSYLALWLTLDLLSFVIIVVLFLYYSDRPHQSMEKALARSREVGKMRIKLYGSNFSPESISLNSGRTRTSYRSRTMKEKLLREGANIDSIDDMEARDNDGLDNRPAYSMTSGQQAYSLSSLAGTDLMRDSATSASMSAVESSLAPPVTVPNRYSV